MTPYVYQCLCFYKNQKKNPVSVVFVLIFFAFIYFKYPSSFALEYLFLMLPIAYTQFSLSVYEEDFKSGMIDLSILKNRQIIPFLLQKNIFFSVLSIFLNLIISVVFKMMTPDVNQIVFFKLSTFMIIETFTFSLLILFLNFMLESRTIVQYLSSIIGLALAFFFIKYASPVNHFYKSLLLVGLLTILFFVMNILYIKKRYRLC
ncbi:MAG: hypothetical protein LBS28_00410 [Streptococcaceae bacterium]|jgi:hypothetical protein|nr:hypothetical protein [Streptococcaceae bacterium]